MTISNGEQALSIRTKLNQFESDILSLKNSVNNLINSENQLSNIVYTVDANSNNNIFISSNNQISVNGYSASIDIPFSLTMNCRGTIKIKGRGYATKEGGAVGQGFLQIYKNGNLFQDLQIAQTISAGTTTEGTSNIIDITNGDKFTFKYYLGQKTPNGYFSANGISIVGNVMSGLVSQ